MSRKSIKYERENNQPAILSRKRKATSEVELLAFSPCSSTRSEDSSSENSPMTDPESPYTKRMNPSYLSFPNTLGQFRGLANIKSSYLYTHDRDSPLPELNWAEHSDLWHSMVLKDLFYPRDHRIFEHHPQLRSRMRAILLDWLIEVCEVYKLHRETFYLAQDYIDRFLLTKPNLPKKNLQLLGITALFVASKMEEIYPPPLEKFSFVTDSACTDQEILAQELILVTTLNWNLMPVTINSWLNTFLQLAFHENGENFVDPKNFPRKIFIQISQVLDLCILDVECLQFSYSLLAAAAIAHCLNKEVAAAVSGLSWNKIQPCARWMDAYVEVVCENGSTEMKHYSDVSKDDLHNIQTHDVGLKMLEQVHAKQRQAELESSPSTPLGVLTPPLSSKKMNTQNIKL